MTLGQKSIFRLSHFFLIIVAIVFLQTATVSFAHAASWLTLDSFSGNPGKTINVSGGGWSANDSIKIYFSSVTGTPVASTTTGANGSFSTSAIIPANAPQGPLSVIGVDAKNVQNSNSYYVVPLSITLIATSTSHSPFSVVSITGTGFVANEMVNISLASATTTTQANSTGAITAKITIPNVSSGLYSIQAVGQSSGAKSLDYLNYFWIDAFYPSISPSSYYVLPGQTLSFNGTGFAANETITVTTMGTTSPLGTITTNASGSFTSAGDFAVPASFAGNKETFTLTGSITHFSTTINVTFGNFYPHASPTSYYVFPTQTVAFNGGGFAANETVNISRTGTSTTLTTFVTDKTGSFTNAGSINIPADAAGSVLNVTLTGATSHVSAQTSIGIGAFYPSISPSSFYVQGNSTITLSGKGFASNEVISISVTGSASSTQVTTTALGTFSVSVMIPFSTKGMATITATGTASKAATSVNVTLAAFYPSVTPSAYFSYPGSTITFSGTGFVPNESVVVSTGSTTLMTLSADLLGKFKTTPILIPITKVSSISYKFTGALSNNPTTNTIALGTLSPYLTSDAYSATPGQIIHVSGSSFASGETITITAGSISTTAVASSTGNVSPVALLVPYNSGTTFHVVFKGNSSGAVGSLDIPLGSFYATLSSNSYYANLGSTINLTATGFAPNETLTISSGGLVATSTVQTNATGTAAIPFNIPFTTSTHSFNITATGNHSGASVTISISLAPINAQISPSAYYAKDPRS